VLDSIGTSQDRKDLTDFVSMHKLNNYEFNINLSQSLISSFILIFLLILMYIVALHVASFF
jgi:hypothetical protein